MKISNVQNQNINCRPNYGVKKASVKRSSSSPAFKGGLINFWDAVYRGGFASTFILQDGLGCCVPRTMQDLHRNEEITGKKNYLAAAETAIREFVTGPSMVVIPMAVLAFAKKAGGSANDVPMENIAPFSEQMKAVLKGMPVEFSKTSSVKDFTKSAKSSFYERMFALSLGENIENGVSETAKDLAKDLMQYDGAKKRNFFQQLLNRDIMKNGVKIEAKDQIAEKIVTKYTDARKVLSQDHSSLLTTDLNGILKKPNKFSSLIKDFSNFGNDVAGSIEKASLKGFTSESHLNFASFMDDFKKVRTGSKFLTNLIMVAATALFMTQVPKLYSISKTNPGTDAFRNEGGEVVRADK